jgi:hypothetical protein
MWKVKGGKRELVKMNAKQYKINFNYDVLKRKITKQIYYILLKDK